MVGRWRESEEQQRRALELDPFSAIFPAYLAFALAAQGRFDEALPFMELSRTRGSPFVGPSNAIPVLLAAGRADEAIEMARASNLSWDAAVAEAVRDGSGPSPALVEAAPISIRSGALLAFLGDREGALTVFEAAVERGAGLVTPLIFPHVRALMGTDPRYQALIERVGLAEP